MYKIDEEFRPRGRVFMKATQESSIPSSSSSTTVERKSSLKKYHSSGQPHYQQLVKGPPITTNIDDRNIRFQHEVKHEKTIQAVIRDYPDARDMPYPPGTSTTDQSMVLQQSISNGSGSGSGNIPIVSQDTQSYQAVTRNKRISTEVLGSSMESTKLSQRGEGGHRRITTHIVRKVTTLSRAEEQAHAQNLLAPPQGRRNSVRTTEIGYLEESRAIEPKRPKVIFSLLVRTVLCFMLVECSMLRRNFPRSLLIMQCKTFIFFRFNTRTVETHDCLMCIFRILIMRKVLSCTCL